MSDRLEPQFEGGTMPLASDVWSLALAPDALRVQPPRRAGLTPAADGGVDRSEGRPEVGRPRSEFN